MRENQEGEKGPGTIVPGIHIIMQDIYRCKYCHMRVDILDMAYHKCRKNLYNQNIFYTIKVEE